MKVTAEQIELFDKLDVMLVDDSRLVLGVISKVLKTLEVGALRTALEGTQAIAGMKTRPANLIITDLDMHPMDGFTLTRSIRSGEGGLDPRTPIISLASTAEPETVKAALRAGVNGYMVKPAEPETMVKWIRKVVTARIIYQRRGQQYIPNSGGVEVGADDLLYDGILPRVFADDTNGVDNPANKGQVDEVWTLD